MLINQKDTLKKYLGGIQKMTHWETWEPFVRNAEQEHIIPAIGQEFYDFLNQVVQPNDSLTAVSPPIGELPTLVEKLRVALVQYVSMDSELSIMLQKGDGGTTVASPPNMQAPGKWAIVGRIKEARDKADKAIERALQYLESKADVFDVWKESPAYTRDHGLFLSGATEYTEYLSMVQGSRRLYVLLRPHVVKSERDLIRPLVGKPFFLHLKEKLKTGATDWSAEEAEAAEMIRQAVANDAFSRALPFLNINGDGRLVSETDGINNEDILPDSRRVELRTVCDSEAQRETAKLKRYLDTTASATVLPTYFQSSSYSSQKQGFTLPDNSDPAKPFIL